MVEMATREAPFAEVEGFETEDIVAFIAGTKAPPKQVLAKLACVPPCFCRTVLDRHGLNLTSRLAQATSVPPSTVKTLILSTAT